jgi:glycosyltransferase involved in cell wall biosynthesis/ubiquinone/menaquinone biosynthesis C-methylase UbiE
MTAGRYLYVHPSFDRTGVLDLPAFEDFTERHKVVVAPPPLIPTPDLVGEMQRGGCVGAILEMNDGLPGRIYLQRANALLKARYRTFFYWPREDAVELIDRERLATYWRLWVLVKGSRRVFKRNDDRAYATRIRIELEEMIQNASPVPLALEHAPTPERPLHETGVYFRTDFWAPIVSGGSYGHTCYVAKELARRTDRFVAILGHRFPLLDKLGVHQVVPEPPGRDGAEPTIIRATPHYYGLLKTTLEALAPAYIYERLCLGNYTGALLSRELGIPYIVEYNGSEVSMMRSFAGQRYAYETLYIRAEQAAFRQATLISVVSQVIRDSLVERGVDPARILVNPNGADLDAYRPVSDEEKLALQRELHLDTGECVVGFTGTFGGWHGIDVLAASIPEICRRCPGVRFLLIGDGSFKQLITDAVEQHQLQDRVLSVGRVPQEEGARLLRACDVYVSPHNAHMVDSRFFGSPTKLFEYMAMGGAIVATRLEQIGEVLSPGLDARALDAQTTVGSARAVLCQPGSVEEFTDAVVFLAEHGALRAQLGRNARQAVELEYSWSRHVERLWQPLIAALPARAEIAAGIATGDAYKDETQRQWDNDPCGSHYITGTPRYTLDWFNKVEDHRYGEYGPWMPDVMEFARHGGEDVLEIGGGMGTDLAQFARHGARVTDVDLSVGHLRLARENFALRGLAGRFVHQDAETLPFPDDSFDLVYSNGVLHHTPNTSQVIAEIFRVLRPGGKVIAMFYAENSLIFWRNIAWRHGLVDTMLEQYSIGEVMSRTVEFSEIGSRPLVKVYSAKRLRRMFRRFARISVTKRQMVPGEVPRMLRRVPARWIARIAGWNLIIKAYKPRLS